MMNKQFYDEMLVRGRLIPFFHQDKLVCLFTFYITDDETPYIQADPWMAQDDNPDGRICYVSQLLTLKEKENFKLAFTVWHRFKVYIKTNFPNVRQISWRRWDGEITRLYKKEIR